MTTIQISTRIDKETKQQFDQICEAIGISTSNALSMFIKSVINHNGIPFSIMAPQGKNPVTFNKTEDTAEQTV